MVVEYNCINKSHLGVKYMSNKTFGMHAATCDRVVLVYFLSTQIGNKKFPVIMRYYCEDIMRIFWFGRKIKAYRAFLQQIINETKEMKTKNSYYTTL